MIFEFKSPKTKLELISALNNLQIDKIVVRDFVSKKDFAVVKKDLERLVSINQKPVSVIIIQER